MSFHDPAAYRTPPTSPTASNLPHPPITITPSSHAPPPTTAPLATSFTATPSPDRHPRRTAYNPTRPVPHLRRENNFFGESSVLGRMVLNSAGVGLINGHQVAGLPSYRSDGHGDGIIPGLRTGMNGYILTTAAAVGEDGGSQFESQGTNMSQVYSQNPFYPTEYGGVNSQSQSQSQPSFSIPPGSSSASVLHSVPGIPSSSSAARTRSGRRSNPPPPRVPSSRGSRLRGARGAQSNGGGGAGGGLEGMVDEEDL